MLLSASVGIHFLGAGGFGLLLGFMGVVTGGILTTVGVRMADRQGPAPTVLVVVFDGPRALAVLVRRNTALVGLIMSSCAVTAVSGAAAGPVLCFSAFALLLLGVSLVIFGARGE